MKRATAAPAHLRPATKRWFSAISKEYELESHHLKLLVAACEAWDRAQEARERVAVDGAYVTDRFGQLRSHPALSVERDSKILFCRVVRELGLDLTPPEESRPPGIRGVRG